MTEPAPRRVRIVSPRSRAVRASTKPPVSREIGEQTIVGEVYMASLVRTQLRLAIGVLLIFAVLLGGLPLLLVLEPGMADIDVLGLPLPWLLLGVVVYPVLIGGGAFYVRRAERNEIDFSEIVERS
jgi:O-antigen/teichoic acid export membrane protein